MRRRHRRLTESDRTFEEIRSLVQAALVAETGDDLWVVDLTDEWVVWERYGVDEAQLQRATYTISDDDTVTVGAAEDVQRRVSYEQVTESTERITSGRLLEARGANASGGRVFGVEIIQAGTSRNGVLYSPRVLEAASDLYEGAKAYDRHRTEAELRSSTITGLVGTYRNVTPTDRGLEAELHLLPSASHVAECLDASLDAQAGGLPPVVGISHDVLHESRPVVVDGRRLVECTRIVGVHSADVVADPSAGGHATRSVAGGIGDHSPKEGTMNLRQLLELLREADAEKRAELLSEHAALLEDNGLTEFDVTRLLTEPEEPAPTTDPEPTPPAGEPAREPALAGATEAFSRDSLMGRRLVRDAVEDLGLSVTATQRMCESVQRFLPDRFTEADLRRTVEQTQAVIEGVESSTLEPRVPHTQVGREDFDRKVERLERTIEGGHPDGYLSLRQAYMDLSGSTVDPLSSELPFAIMRESFQHAPVEGQLRSTESVDSTTWGAVFADVMHKRLLAEYAVPGLQSWRSIVDRGSFPDFREQKLVRYGGYGTLPTVAEGGPYQPLTTPPDEDVRFAPEKRGGTEDLTIEAIANDDLRAVQRIPRRLGRAAAQTVYRAVFDLLADNPTIYDSVALFAAAHANTDASTALSHAGLSTGRRRMRQQAAFGDATEILGTVPRALIVPSDLEDIGHQLSSSARAVPATTPGATDVPNLHQGLELIVVDYFAASGTWFLAADPRDVPTIEVGFYGGREEPELFVQDDPRVGAAFTADKITWKIRHIWGITVVDYRGLYRGVA